MGLSEDNSESCSFCNCFLFVSLVY